MSTTVRRLPEVESYGVGYRRSNQGPTARGSARYLALMRGGDHPNRAACLGLSAAAETVWSETMKVMRTRLAAFRRDGGYHRWDSVAEWPLVVLGLLFVAVLILPLAEPLTGLEVRWLGIANVVIWAIFVVDYVARVYLSLDRGKWIRTHLLDLIVIAVPFLRPFRLLRLLAIVVATGRRAGGLVVQQVTLYVVCIAVVISMTSAVVVYNAERHAPDASIRTLGDAMWWALSTVTTVGYGDVYPVTVGGRFMAALLMITGIALVGTITAAVASWFVNVVRQSETAEIEEEATDERMQLRDQLVSVLAAVENLQREVAQLRDATTARHDRTEPPPSLPIASHDDGSR
jgi:voltage-gated potassium channel